MSVSMVVLSGGDVAAASADEASEVNEDVQRASILGSGGSFSSAPPFPASPIRRRKLLLGMLSEKKSTRATRYPSKSHFRRIQKRRRALTCAWRPELCSAFFVGAI